MNDIDYMTLALQLAQKGQYTCRPNPCVGCLIVRDDKIIAEGWHQKAGEDHAEIVALKLAGEKAKEATVYVTLEPCSHQGKTGPCVEALISAGVKTVVVAMEDPNPNVCGQGIEALKKAGIEIRQAVLADQAKALNKGYIMRMENQRPFVRCKLAMSLDGRTAMASGESHWITSAPARQDVQRLRAKSSAILSGIGTVLTDNPRLTVRLDEIVANDKFEQPIRIILDPHLSTPANAAIFSEPGKTVIVTTSDDSEVVNELSAAGAEILCQEGHSNTIDLSELLHYLAELEINDVMMETGATLSGAMLQAGLIDELIIYMAPHLMGNKARGLFNLPWLDAMKDRVNVNISDIRAVGSDWRIEAQITQH